MAQQDFEKLGAFYLGRSYDIQRKVLGTEPLLYDSKDPVTHAVCVGMTGSGKTGLCLALIEEAAIDGIPTIAIDPKGDLGSLLLTSPQLRAEENAGAVRQQLADLDAEFHAETAALEAQAAATEDLETVAVKPKKSQIAVQVVALAWVPHWRDANGGLAAAWT